MRQVPIPRSIRHWGLAWLLAVGCSPPAPPPDLPNLVIFSLDTTRADHTSVGGYARDTTPHLAAIAAAGASFPATYAPAPSTAPSHASLFTSLHPIEHGLDHNSLVLDSKVETLAERLAAVGVATAGFPSTFVLDERWGVAQGFQTWDDEFLPEQVASRVVRNGQAVENRFDRTARFTTDRAIQWLDRARDPKRPFFLFVHYFDAHAPYEPPAPYDARFRGDGKNRGVTELQRKVIDAYDGEIAYIDAEMGRVLDRITALGLDANTIVVVISDHGEGLSEHGVWGHTVDVYEELVRVPLVFRWPGHVRAGSVVAEPVALIDVTPTLLDLIGVPADGAPLSGRSLAPTLRDGAALDPEHPIYLQRRNYERRTLEQGVPVIGAQFGIRMGRWKWIEGTRDGMRALFDLEHNADETVNRATNEPAKAAALAEYLASWRAARVPQAPPARPLSADEAEKLRALGYAE